MHLLLANHSTLKSCSYVCWCLESISLSFHILPLQCDTILQVSENECTTSEITDFLDVLHDTFQRVFCNSVTTV
jgi:hypothetical protein